MDWIDMMVGCQNKLHSFNVGGGEQSGGTHLGEIEESRLAEQDVRQIHRAAGQHLDLVFTEMMAPQELSKVPGGRSTRQTDMGW